MAAFATCLPAGHRAESLNANRHLLSTWTFTAASRVDGGRPVRPAAAATRAATMLRSAFVGVKPAPFRWIAAAAPAARRAWEHTPVVLAIADDSAEAAESDGNDSLNADGEATAPPAKRGPPPGRPMSIRKYKNVDLRTIEDPVLRHKLASMRDRNRKTVLLRQVIAPHGFPGRQEEPEVVELARKLETGAIRKMTPIDVFELNGKFYLKHFRKCDRYDAAVRARRSHVLVRVFPGDPDRIKTKFYEWRPRESKEGKAAAGKAAKAAAKGGKQGQTKLQAKASKVAAKKSSGKLDLADLKKLF
eukprot:tig00000042_g15604.t1